MVAAAHRWVGPPSRRREALAAAWASSNGPSPVTRPSLGILLGSRPMTLLIENVGNPAAVGKNRC